MTKKDKEARVLAQAHYEIEPGITEIYRITNGASAEKQANEPIKLLEVNRFTISAGVMPLGFGPLPRHGIHYPSIIVEVTPEEFDKIRTKKLKLPNGWIVGALLPRPSGNGDE